VYAQPERIITIVATTDTQPNHSRNVQLQFTAEAGLTASGLPIIREAVRLVCSRLRSSEDLGDSCRWQSESTVNFVDCAAHLSTELSRLLAEQLNELSQSAGLGMLAVPAVQLEVA